MKGRMGLAFSPTLRRAIIRNMETGLWGLSMEAPKAAGRTSSLLTTYAPPRVAEEEHTNPLQIFEVSE